VREAIVFDVEERAGFRVTTPLRTLIDGATGGVSQEQLVKAMREALSRGLVRRSNLIAAVRSHPGLKRLMPALTQRRTATR
jgi:hypothetical protein